MKRLIAKRKLKSKCIDCNCSFEKGNVYYKTREVFEEYGKIYVNEYITCPKCKYKNEQHKKRYEKFKEKCTHPDWAIDTKYTVERCPSPDYDYCRLCGKTL